MNDYPFAQPKTKWGSTLWSMFAQYHWYRRLCGGLWQQFDLGSNGRPFLQWMSMNRNLAAAKQTEDYRRK
jgi:hypothetical protein